MESKVHYLPNGIPVVLTEMPGLESFTMIVMVRGGSRYETLNNSGVYHLLEHMMFKGTPRQPDPKALNRELDLIGECNAFTGDETVGFYVKSQEKYFGQVCGILADQLANPLMPESELVKEKNVVCEEINAANSDANDIAYRALRKSVYGNSPAGVTSLGTAKNVNAASQQDLFNLVRECFVTENIVISVAGRLPKDVLEIVRDNFAATSRGSALEPFPVQVSGRGPKSSISFWDVSQTELRLGFLCPGRSSEKRYALTLLDYILGTGMSCRLFSEIREERGLCYAIGTGVDFMQETGLFVVATACSPNNVSELVSATTGELARLVRDGVPEAELNDAKTRYEKHFAFSFENTRSTAAARARRMLHFGNILPYEERLALIKQVTATDIQNIAREIFTPENAHIVTVGPHQEEDAETFKNALVL